jgi:hypothetical protein
MPFDAKIHVTKYIQLHSPWSELVCLSHTIPILNRLWFSPPEFPNGRSCKGYTSEHANTGFIGSFDDLHSQFLPVVHSHYSVEKKLLRLAKAMQQRMIVFSYMQFFQNELKWDSRR